MDRELINKERARGRMELVRPGLFALLGAVIICAFTQSASLLYEGATSDYNCFVFMARAWGDGYVPYADFVDNKGALLFLIDRMGLWLAPGKAGIFVLEVLAFAATFELLWRSGRRLGATWRQNLAAAGVCAFLYVYHLIEGNTVEEWSLPLTALAVYVLSHAGITKPPVPGSSRDERGYPRPPQRTEQSLSSLHRPGLITSSALRALLVAIRAARRPVQRVLRTIRMRTRHGASLRPAGWSARRVWGAIRGRALVVGVCMGLAMMLRVNNGTVIGGLALGVGINLCCAGRWREALRCAVAFVAGVLLAVGPFVAYFAAKGALEEMWFATVFVNMQYTAGFSPEGRSLRRIVENMLQMGAAVVLPIVAGMADRRRFLAPALCASVLTVVPLVTGTGFAHYFLLMVPLAWPAVVLAGRISRGCVLMAVAAVVVPEVALHPRAAWWYAGVVRENVMVESPGAKTRALAGFIAENVPEDELGDVYMACAPGDVAAFDVLGVRPVGRYVYQQDVYHRLSPAVARDIERDLAERRPGWVVTYLPLEAYPWLVEAGYVEVARTEVDRWGYGWFVYKAS